MYKHPLDSHAKKLDYFIVAKLVIDSNSRAIKVKQCCIIDEESWEIKTRVMDILGHAELFFSYVDGTKNATLWSTLFLLDLVAFVSPTSCKNS
jgi:hypothetical protein